MCLCSILFFYNEKENIKLVDATFQLSTSGIQGGANSTEYYFKLKILTPEKIDFDSIWVSNKVFKPFLSNNKPVISDQAPSFSKNDTIILRISDMKVNASFSAKAPIKYQGSALLRYKVKGSSHYLVIKQIKSVQGVNRP